ncbi:hypothetical protein ACFXJ5_03255 [Streptomyces sp. NPDC059373]
MDNVITVAVILSMIVLGALMIHLLNGQHAERISAFHYSKPVPGAATPRRDHRDGGRGRLRPRGNQTRSRRT